MKYEHSFCQQTIIADNPSDYDRMMNEVFKKGTEITVSDKDIQDKFCSVVRYKIHREIPENSLEEHEIKGDRRYCCECKHWKEIRPTKGNVKYTFCEHEGRTNANARVCNYFWEMMDAGMSMLEVQDAFSK